VSGRREAITVALAAAADIALGAVAWRLAGGGLLLAWVTALLLGAPLAWAGAYGAPRAWGPSDAVPVVLRAGLVGIPLASAKLLALQALGLAAGGPRLGVALAAWGALLAGVLAARLALGRLQVALVRRGLGARRAVIVGAAEDAARVAARLARHPWLGERVVGRAGPGPGALGGAADLAAIVARHAVASVWLAPPASPADGPGLPAWLHAPDGGQVIWRILPEDWPRLGPDLARLGPDARARVDRRLRRDLELPTFRVAMVGSRGVPASYSGVERYVEEVGSHLAACGARVAVYCHARYVSARGTHRGLALRFVPAIRSRHLETLSHTVLATLDVLLRPDEIVHYHALGPSTLAWLPRLAGRRVVATVQGLDWQRAKWGRAARAYLKLGEWATARLPHATIVVSRTLAEHYRARWGCTPVYIPNGFHRPVSRPPRLIKELGLDRDGYLLFVGRLVPEKEVHTLLAAYRRTGTELPLVIAGGASYEDAYRRRLEDEARGLPGVRFVGFVTGELLDELYTSAYVVVHPSQMEGLSVALLEALSHSNCVVVSDVPENREAIGEAGYTFRVGDADDLARVLGRLLDRPAEVEAMRARARAAAARLADWEAVAVQTQRVYAALVAPPGRTASG
jgi:glycosyltransferase involved in cell wall biosynthesis